ncbi:unnamed protein product [Caenorhabditis nigoni]
MHPNNDDFLMKYIRQLEFMKFLAARIRFMHVSVDHDKTGNCLLLIQGDFHVPRRHRHRYPHRDCIFVIPDDCDGPVNESEKDITDFLSTVLKKGFTYKGCEDTFDKEGIIDIVKDIEDNEDLYWDITTIQVRNTTADLIVEVTLGKSILMKAKAVFDLDDKEFVSAEAVGCKNNKEE